MRAYVVVFSLLGLVACGNPGRDADDDSNGVIGTADADGSDSVLAGDGDPAGSDGDSGGDGGDGADGDSLGSDGGDSSGGDGGGDGDANGDGDGDGGPVLPLGRGLAWVRENPMFISGLTVAMGPPTQAFVDAYYDDYHATATHLWANGLPTEVTAWASFVRSDFRYVVWTESNGHTVGGELMGGMSAALPGRIGYQVGDEPGIQCGDDPANATCALDSLAAMSAGVDALRALDPDALIFCNFGMVGFLDEVLARYATEVDADVVSYDSYGPGRSSYTALEKFRAAGLATGRPYWRYLRSYVADTSPDDRPTPVDLRWDAMSGVLYGYTGHTWFIYDVGSGSDLDPVVFANDGDFAAARTELFDVIAGLNLELANLGRVLTQLTSTDVRYKAALAFRAPEGTRGWTPGAGGDPFLASLAAKDNTLLDLSVGFFRDDRGERYAMVQNVSHDSGEYPVDWTGDATVRLGFDFASAPANVNRTRLLVFDKATGATTQVPFTSTSGSTATLDVMIKAGDLFFWKYDTGRDFARR